MADTERGGLNAMQALLGALERRHCVAWTGSVLVEADETGVIAGPVTMVLDAADFAALREFVDAASALVDSIAAAIAAAKASDGPVS